MNIKLFVPRGFICQNINDYFLSFTIIGILKTVLIFLKSFDVENSNLKILGSNKTGVANKV